MNEINTGADQITEEGRITLCDKINIEKLEPDSIIVMKDTNPSEINNLIAQLGKSNKRAIFITVNSSFKFNIYNGSYTHNILKSFSEEKVKQEKPEAKRDIKDMENLCDTCVHYPAICEERGEGIVWGIDVCPTATGKDADKVVECKTYKSRKR